jgi:hypothetical protein
MSDFDDDDMLYDSDAGSMGEVADEDDPAVRAENRYFEAKGMFSSSLVLRCLGFHATFQPNGARFLNAENLRNLLQ